MNLRHEIKSIAPFPEYPSFYHYEIWPEYNIEYWLHDLVKSHER